MQALMPGAKEFDLNAAQLLAVIEGCQMDLSQTRYLDRAALERYAHLVAGVVGEVSARIFGQTETSTTAYAHRLGLAFQWTNILRDVGEDALRGRIYLPIADMQRHPHCVRPRRPGAHRRQCAKFGAAANPPGVPHGDRCQAGVWHGPRWVH